MSTKLIHILTSVSLALSLAAWPETASVAYAAAGALDTTFGTAGKVITPIGSGNDAGRAVAIQLDGKIVVAADSANDIAVVRYNTDGSLDNSFSSDGIQIVNISDGSIINVPTNDSVNDVAIQSDGKIVVIGHNGADFAVARFCSNGHLDDGTAAPSGCGGSGFDTDGIQTTDVSGNTSTDYGFAGAIQPDGKIVVAGESDSDIAVVRYNTDSLLDTSFDSNGIKAIDISGNGSADSGHSVAIQSDGKIVVAGESDGDLVVVRYNVDGSLDTSFDTDGKRIGDIDGNNPYYYVALQPDGKIVVAGEGGNTGADSAVVRYNTDGSLDTSFDSNGKRIDSIGSTSTYSSVTIQPDGKIVVVGSTDFNFLAVLYNTDGSLDTSFDSNGKRIDDLGSNDSAYAVTVQPDGRIVVVGQSNNQLAVVRYEGGLNSSSSTNVTASISLTAFEALLSLFAHNILFPPLVIPGNITIDEIVLLAADFVWQATDSNTVAAGWHVTLSANDFSDGSGNSIPVSGFKAQMFNTDIGTVSGNAPPTSQVPIATSLSSSAISLISAASGNGIGTYNFAPHFQLTVPGTTVHGNYNTAVTVTIISGP